MLNYLLLCLTLCIGISSAKDDCTQKPESMMTVTHLQVPTDGFGFQFLWIISAVCAAEASNMRYVYTPFQRMQHNYDGDADFIQKKEWLINFIDNFEINTPDHSQGAIHASAVALDMTSREDLTKMAHSCALKKIKRIFRENKDTKSYFKNSNLNIAVHVRRPNPRDTTLDGADTPDDVFLKSINKLREVHAAQRPLFHVYSQGNKENFKKFEAPDTVLHLNESIEDSFISMVLADVLVMARSTFSYTAGLLSEGIVYYMQPWHAPAPHWISVDELLK